MVEFSEKTFLILHPGIEEDFSWAITYQICRIDPHFGMEQVRDAGLKFPKFQISTRHCHMLDAGISFPRCAEEDLEEARQIR